MKWLTLVAALSDGKPLDALSPNGEGVADLQLGDGCGLEPDRWRRLGDGAELEVEGLGVLRNRVVHPGGPV